MAIYFAQTSHITRGKGQSAVASSAYRSGEKLQDNKYGKVQDYTKKQGVKSADLILPQTLKGKFDISREELWNKAEFSEKANNARVAREWLINLPHELSEPERKELAHEFAQMVADKYGVIADVCIHEPTAKEIAKGADPRNHHAHIMFTTREIEFKNDIVKFGKKATSELSDTDRKKLGLGKGADDIEEIRLVWENMVNARIVPLGIEPVDRRSYERQGKDTLPQVKVGKNATQMERNGISTWQGRANVEIKAHNIKLLAPTATAPTIPEPVPKIPEVEQSAPVTVEPVTVEYDPTTDTEPTAPDDNLQQAFEEQYKAWEQQQTLETAFNSEYQAWEQQQAIEQQRLEQLRLAEQSQTPDPKTKNEDIQR